MLQQLGGRIVDWKHSNSASRGTVAASEGVFCYNRPQTRETLRTASGPRERIGIVRMAFYVALQRNGGGSAAIRLRLLKARCNLISGRPLRLYHPSYLPHSRLHSHSWGPVRMAFCPFFFFLVFRFNFPFDFNTVAVIDLHRHFFPLVLFLLCGCVTIRRWKCKRVPVTIVSTVPHPMPVSLLRSPARMASLSCLAAGALSLSPSLSLTLSVSLLSPFLSRFVLVMGAISVFSFDHPPNIVFLNRIKLQLMSWTLCEKGKKKKKKQKCSLPQR